MSAGIGGRCSPVARQKQKGVAALMTAVFLLSAVICLVLVVDTGRLYYERRSLQRVADMAALDAASQGGICGNNQSSQLLALAQGSAAENGYPVSYWVPSNIVRPGFLVLNGGNREFRSDASRFEAVEVVLNKTVPASLIAGGLFGNSAVLSARAVARRTAEASFTVGSGLLSLNTDKSVLLGPILGGLLGSNVNVGALDYNGIVGAKINLIDFLNLVRVEAGLGSVNDVLTSNVSAIKVVRVIADAMAQSTNSGVVNVGSSLVGGTLANISGATVRLGDILGLQAGSTAINSQLTTAVNLFDLLMASAVAANGTNSIALNVPTIANLAGASLKITEAPKTGYGMPGTNAAKITAVNTEGWNAFANTGQVDLVLVLKPVLSNILPAVGGVVDVNLDMAVRVGLAEAKGWLKSIECSTFGNKTTRVVLGTSTQTDNLRITSKDNENSPAVLKIDLLGTRIATVGVAAGGASIIGSANRDVAFTVDRSAGANGHPKNTISPSVSRISSNVNLALPPLQIKSLHDESPSCGGLLGCVVGSLIGNIVNILGGIVGGVSGLVNMVLDVLSNAIVAPLLQALGINLGYSDIRLVDVTEGRAELVN